MRSFLPRLGNALAFRSSLTTVLLVLVCCGTVRFHPIDATEAAEAQQSASRALSIEGIPLGDSYPYRSPLAISLTPDGRVAYVIHHTARRVEAIQLGSGEVIWSRTLQAAPTGLALDHQRNRLFVTTGLALGQVIGIDTTRGDVVQVLSAGHTPTSPLVTSDGQTLYVCNRFDHHVAVYDLSSGRVRNRIEVAREPISAALTPNEKLLVVANHLPAQASTSGHVAATVDVIETESCRIVASALLPSGSTGVRTVCVSPDGQYAYVTHTLGRFHLPTTQLERGWMNTNALSVIGLTSEEVESRADQSAWLTTVLLDDVNRGAANPWGVVCSADGRNLVVAHSGTHELSVIDRVGLHDKLQRLVDGQRVSGVSATLADVPNDLGFLVGLRQRVPLSGNGPRGLAIAGDTVVAAEYFSDTLASLQLSSAGEFVPKTISLGEVSDACDARLGEQVFFDATYSLQNWQSCASCHPDVRADALNWDLLNDGIGNPKNNRSLLFSHATPPVMISGVRPTAEVAVRGGFRFIQFVEPPEEIPLAVDAFLRSLRPVPSPHLVDGKLSAAALRGKSIFDSARCTDCHDGEHYTDGNHHDVGTGPDERGIRGFIPPLLNEVWRTAPYLYDGRAVTLKEVFREFNPNDRHGQTTDLTAQELDDLVQYVLSL